MDPATDRDRQIEQLRRERDAYRKRYVRLRRHLAAQAAQAEDAWEFLGDLAVTVNASGPKRGR